MCVACSTWAEECVRFVVVGEGLQGCRVVAKGVLFKLVIRGMFKVRLKVCSECSTEDSGAVVRLQIMQSFVSTVMINYIN